MADDRRSRLPLHVTLAGLLVGLLLLAVGGVVAIVLVVRSRSVEATVRALATQSSRTVTDRIARALGAVEQAAVTCVDSAARGLLPVEDPARLAEHMAAAVRHDARFDSLGWLTASKDAGAGASRQADGKVLLLWSEPDPAGGEARIRAAVIGPDGGRQDVPAPVSSLKAFEQVPWFDAGANAAGAAWSERYRRPVDGTWARMCAHALRREGRLVGVFGVGFGMAFVADVLASLRVGDTGGVLLLEPASGAVRTAPSPEGEARLGLPVAAVVAALSGGAAGLPLNETVSRTVDVGGESWIVGLTRQGSSGRETAIHAVVVPEKELAGFLGRYLQLGLVAVLALLGLAVLLATRLASQVSRPLRAIADDLRRVGAFELSDEPAPRSRIEEVAVLGDAADRMKKSLRSFGRYVPTDLVRDLLGQGQEARLGGAVRPLTLFFSDVKGFTSLSEGLEPGALVEALGDYLDVVTRTVTAGGGTIDKFMGDGVLAFWGAPHDDPRHVARACRTALAVQDALTAARARWAAAGRPAFFTRIGLHTANVLVGNIGTPERFAYTVIGDGVNLAARLESLNKVYGTWIMASRETLRAAGEGLVWRRLDRTAVAGRTGGDDVYELLGEVGRVDAAVLAARDAYEAAFEQYLARRFDAARAGFEAALRERPEDLAASLLAARARTYAATPPPPDWDGVFAHQHK